MTSRNRDRASVGADLRLSGTALRPLVVLAGVALAWGLAFVVVKSAVGQLPPAALVAWRFTVATALVLAVNPRCLRHLSRRTLGRSAVLGGLFGTGFLLQTWGIESTSVVVSAFIAGSVVVLAPVVARVWFGRRLGGGARLAVMLATAGLAMISLRGAALGLGELLTLGAAVLWAVHLVALEVWVAREDVYASALVQLAVVALLAWTVQAVSPVGVVVPSGVPAWAAVIGLGAVATGAAVVLLTWAQARVDSTSSAVVLTLEPVFGAIAAVVFGGEELAALTSIGAIAVVLAALVAARAGPGPDPGIAVPLAELVLAQEADQDHDHPLMERY
jgi:drug/metabolite transporter (DMT)-like permease